MTYNKIHDETKKQSLNNFEDNPFNTITYSPNYYHIQKEYKNNRMCRVCILCCFCLLLISVLIFLEKDNIVILFNRTNNTQ